MNRWNGLILALYLSIVAAIYLFLSTEGRIGLGASLAAFAAILAALCAVCPPLMRRLERVHIRQVDPPKRSREALWFLLFLALSLAVLLLRFRSVYPGMFSPDSVLQYQQALSGEYNDWHPVLHTLLAFTLPLKLTGAKSSIVLFQMVEFSLALAYAGCVIRRHVHNLWAILIVALVLAFRSTSWILSHAWKDGAFAIGALLIATFAFQTHCSGGAWIERPWHALLFSVTLAATTFFRHNAILFTLPMLIGVMLYAGRGGKVRVAALFLVALLLVKGPLYSALDVQKPGQRQSELLGLPMTMIANVVKEHPESLDEETREFAYAYASQEEWETSYETGNFNSIKFTQADEEIIERAGIPKVLRITWKCFRAEPACALYALFKQTEFVYIPTSNNIARLNLLLVLLIAVALPLGRGCDLRRLLLCGAPLCYNFGTMLLLAGEDTRFFYYFIPVFPLLALLLVIRKEAEGVEISK